MPAHTAKCHCGSVVLNFEAPETLPVTICNCSICAVTAYQHVFVPQDNAKISGQDNLNLYTFGSEAAKHYFCGHCGIKPFYIPKSHPKNYSVNLRCIVGGTVKPEKFIQFDGQNWNQNIDDLRKQT